MTRALGLCAYEAHFVHLLPGVTLATENLVSVFGLHRRLRVHSWATWPCSKVRSVVPMSRYLAAAERIGGLPALERSYRVHVEVDEHQARPALDAMVAPMVEAWPDLGPDVVFGAAALSRVEARFAGHILRAWDSGTSSLRAELALSA